MAKFEIAESITGKNEGGYANNPDDRGGETYAGIARRYWPNWKGWLTIDRIKRDHGRSAIIINKYAKADLTLSHLISLFYKNNFWDINLLDLINDQQLANNLYDFSVNHGEEEAAVFLQYIVNNRLNGTKLILDGDFGTKTINAINSLNAKELYEAYNAKRKAYYISIAKGKQAKFLKSWLSRLRPYKQTT